jgi:3-oxoacyl-[acyl-carrier-protein] synthase-3
MSGLLTRGFYSAEPKVTLTNGDIAEHVDTNDEWIVERTGIRERKVVVAPWETDFKSDDERRDAITHYTLELAEEAARGVLERAETEPEEIGIVGVASISKSLSRDFPSLASHIQDRLGIPEVGTMTYDLEAGCAGYVHLLQTIEGLLQITKLKKKALIIGAEVLSLRTKWSDYERSRGTGIVFGDGGAAGLYEALNDEEEPGRTLASHFEAHGSTNKALFDDGFINMNGREVFKWATRSIPNAFRLLLEEAGVNIEQIELFIIHQANERIIMHGLKKTIEDEKLKRQTTESGLTLPNIDDIVALTPLTVRERGNMSAASTPHSLYVAREQGLLENGTLMVTMGYGAGGSLGSRVEIVNGLPSAKAA